MTLDKTGSQSIIKYITSKTNIDKEHFTRIHYKYNFEEIFDVISVSDYYRSGKDNKLIFEKTIHTIQVEPEDCIFIDNTAKNLIIPQKMGMKTILFDDESRDINAFQTILYSSMHKDFMLL